MSQDEAVGNNVLTSASAFLAAAGRPIVRYPVRAMDGAVVCLRCPTAGDVVKVGEIDDEERATHELFAIGVVSPDGDPIFADADEVRRMFDQASAAAIVEIGRELRVVSGLTDEPADLGN